MKQTGVDCVPLNISFILRGDASHQLKQAELNDTICYVDSPTKSRWARKWAVVGGTVWQLSRYFSEKSASFLVIDEG